VTHWAIHSAEREWVLSGVRDVTASDAFNGSALARRATIPLYQQEQHSGEHEGACARLRRRHDLLFGGGGREFATLWGVGSGPPMWNEPGPLTSMVNSKGTKMASPLSLKMSVPG
jgi:hypothetical protein